VALGFGGYLADFIDLPIVFGAIFILGALSVINFFGIRESSWTNVLFTLVEAGGLVLIIYIGFTFATPEPVNYFESPTGISGIAIAFVLVFFAYIGFEDMANVAEEVKRPSRTIPRAIILSVAISGAIYVLVSLSVVRVVNWQDLGESAAPLALVAERAFGAGGHVLLSSIALFATTNTVLIILIAGARIFYGMAHDKSFPTILGKIHFKTKTPWIAVILVMMASMAFAFVGDIVLVANISVFAIVITFAMVNLALIVLRYTEPTIERPFRVPFNIKKFPILPLFGLALSVYMGFQFELPVLAVGGAIIVTGALFYFVFNKRKMKTVSDT
jgi:APA family basic amino acid/polyamine antiporter